MAFPTTQPKRESPLLRLLSVVILKAHTISLWLIVASVMGLLALPLLDRSIRFDEKGLLVGMSHPTVGLSATADAAELARISRSAGGAAAFQRPGAAAALTAELRSAGLTDTQLTRPTVLAPGPAGAPPSPCRCANVHSRVRSPRGDGLESLALVTPLAFSPQRPDPAHDGRNQSAEGAELALMAAAGLVLHMARGHVAAGSGGDGGAVPGGGRWLVRDLLWVVPDLSCGGQHCLEAWVRQYYCDMVLPGPVGSGSGLRGGGGQQQAGQVEHALHEAPPAAAGAMIRAGVIQQAVVLEALAGPSYDTPELLVMGHDGLLPKLDMFYLLRYLFNYPVGAVLWRDDRLEASHQTLITWLTRLGALLPEGLLPPQAIRSYVRRLLTGLQFSWQQAVGRPAGSHAAFKDFMVDAATVRLVQRRPPPETWHQPGGAGGPVPDEQLLRQRASALSYSLELTLRSLNNLVGRMHYPSFLYLLTDVDRYVSVERYVAPAVALTAALQLQAAWSMAAAQRALELALPAAAAAAAATHVGHASAARIWSVAMARAAARTTVLATSAAGLRALACGSPSWLQGGVAAAAATGSPTGAGVPQLAAAVVAAVRSILARRLATPEGLLAVGALLLGTGAAAVAVAGVAGRLAGAAASGAWSDRGSREVDEPKPPVAEQEVATRAEAVVAGLAQGCGRDGKQDESGEQQGVEEGSQALRAAAWHAERVVVLTATAAAMTALVCLNWAAAVVAGMYLAPLALWQGWGMGRALWPQARSQAGDDSARGTGRRVFHRQVVRMLVVLVWVALNPLVFMFTVSNWASAVGFGQPASILFGTVARGLCAMSSTNYWYASVVVLSFWLFGVHGSFAA